MKDLGRRRLRRRPCTFDAGGGACRGAGSRRPGRRGRCVYRHGGVGARRGRRGRQCDVDDDHLVRRLWVRALERRWVIRGVCCGPRGLGRMQRFWRLACFRDQIGAQESEIGPALASESMAVVLGPNREHKRIQARKVVVPHDATPAEPRAEARTAAARAAEEARTLLKAAQATTHEHLRETLHLHLLRIVSDASPGLPGCTNPYLRARGW